MLILFLCCCLLCGCAVSAVEPVNYADGDKHYYVSEIGYSENFDDVSDDNNDIENEHIKGIWVSQFDMHPIYRDGKKQRDIEDYRDKVKILVDNLKSDGFNTVFLQVRPNGDSMFESEIYPLSKYVAGQHGGNIDYDAVTIFLSIAKEAELSVHAWINPFRLCHEEEIIAYGKGQIYDWYCEGLGKRIEIDGEMLYLDPAYEEATALIADGAREILEKYDFDGIHLDDYFYPTEFEFQDEKEFLASGYESKGDFRRANIDRTVKALYAICHEYGKIFGIAPAGNIYSLADGWYVDIYEWCRSDGYIDYIMPQLYYGFENATCPFDEVLKDWVDAVSNDNIKLYIGISAAKCALGSEGIADEFAGAEGEFEWRDNKDILARSLAEMNLYEKVEGFCIFTYSSFYDPLTGEDNQLTSEEKSVFCDMINK